MAMHLPFGGPTANPGYASFENFMCFSSSFFFFKKNFVRMINFDCFFFFLVLPQILYKNVAHPKLSAFIKSRTWLNKSEEFLVFPHSQSEFEGGASHYVDSIEEVCLKHKMQFHPCFRHLSSGRL